MIRPVAPSPFALCAAIIAAAAGLLGGGAAFESAAPPATRAPSEGAFTHAKHVPSAWYATKGGAFVNPEVPRDCRGCHAFVVDADGRERSTDPQDSCAACHYGRDAGGKPVLDFGAGRTDWAALAASWRGDDPMPPTFLHGDHGALHCRDCHAGEIEEGPGGVVKKDVMDVPRGATFCVDCHDPKREKDVPPRLFAGAKTKETCAKLDRGPRMAHVDRYRHDEHFRIADSPKAGDCDKCHDLAKSTARDLARAEYPAASCRPCHGAAGTAEPLEFAHRETTRPSRAALTFDHADHLGARGAKDRGIAEQGCLACHVYDERAATYDLRPGFGSYSACADCHQRVLADAAAAALPPHVADHGRWDDANGWGKCRLCHALDAVGAAAAPRGMKLNRPLAKKGGRAAGSDAVFRVATQRHPHVTSPDGRPVEGRCVACHVAGLPELPSRIVEARFSHATHLPKDATAGSESCADCHRTNAFGATSLDSLYDANYDAAACARCHSGSPPERVVRPATSATPAAPPRAEFDHRFHLAAREPGAARTMNCADCHVLGADGVDYAQKQGVSDCMSCHRHDAERAASTGGKDAAYVAACVACHADYVPERGEVVNTTRHEIAGLKSGKQYHPPTTADSCRGCHKTEIARPLRVEEARVAAVADPPSPHRVAESGRGARYPKTPAGADVDCDACHWRGWDSYDDNLLTPALRGMRGKVAEVRTKRGGLLDAYPGGGAPR